MWRRRRCLDCYRVFTTHEAADLGAVFSVSKQGKKEPFLADKLYTEVLLALQDRKNCYNDAREATATIIRQVLEGSPETTIPSGVISEAAASVLKKLDKRAWMRFVAEHPSQVNKEPTSTGRRRGRS